ncbi:MAG: FG-GAP repeat protein [bacterium]|nr:FG-GAP repeat protein [bacterium]
MTGFDDLAVGLPDNDNGAWSTPAASGSATASAAASSWRQASWNAPSRITTTGGFTLATGDFNGATAATTWPSAPSARQRYRRRDHRAQRRRGRGFFAIHDVPPGVLGGSLGSRRAGSEGLATGDLDQDGFDDLVVGAQHHGAVGSSGRVYVLYGGGRRPPAPGWTRPTIPVGCRTPRWNWAGAWRSGTSSDLDGNAPLQFIAGAPGYESGGQNDTGAFVLFSHDDAGRALGNTRMALQPAGEPVE